jgi:hypothetical protein
MGELINLISSGESLVTAIGEMIRIAGLAALVIVLIIGFIFFVPSIVASLRHIKLRIFVCVLNVLAIATVFLKIFIPVLIWLFIMILAISGKPVRQNKNVIPTINIITTKEDE